MNQYWRGQLAATRDMLGYVRRQLIDIAKEDFDNLDQWEEIIEMIEKANRAALGLLMGRSAENNTDKTLF